MKERIKIKLLNPRNHTNKLRNSTRKGNYQDPKHQLHTITKPNLRLKHLV